MSEVDNSTGKLVLECRLTAQGDHYEVGTTVNGVWIALGAVPASHVDAGPQEVIDGPTSLTPA